MPREMQTSLSGGELSPSLHSHADLAKYRTGLALCENWFVQAQGGISTRTGFEYVAEVEDSTSAARVIPFQFNTEQTYALVLTDLNMRVVRNGGVVLETGKTITGATQANPVEITATGHSYSTGEEVYISGIVGMTELNGRFFKITSTGANTFTLDGINGTGYTAYTSGGTSERVYTVTTPWAGADLFRLKFTQSADVMTVTHPSYDPREITRSAHDNWSISTISFAAGISAPSAGLGVTQVGTASGSNNKTYRYVVTSVGANGNESEASEIQTSGSINALNETYGNQIIWNYVTGADYFNVYKEFALNSGIFGWIGETRDTFDTADISGATKALTAEITATAHGFSTGDVVYIQDVGGMIELNDRSFTITVTGSDTFTLDGENSLLHTTYTSGGTASRQPRFTDYNLGPDMTVTPPIANDPFNGADNRPSCVTEHQQRLCFAATNSNKQTFWATRTADFDNMDYSRPLRSDDSIEATLAARQVNEIRHVLSLGDLLVFTSGGEWLAAADQDGVLTPANFNFKSQGFRGSSHVPPLTIGDTALFVQEKGARVRDLRYAFETDKYGGDDLTILSRHMFEGHEIVDWCYAQEPYSVVWAVRDDGVLLSMSYLREHQVYGWARHTTDGVFESVCSISEGDQDVVYAVVKRTIDGSDVRYVERMHERDFTDVEDAFCVDSGLTYSGTSTTTITNLHHLEGETVVALADGNVVTNLTVTDGSVTLPNAAEKVHIGLGYNCDFMTLEASLASRDFGISQSRKKQIARVALRVIDSRGLSVGRDSTTLYEFKERTPAMNYGNIPGLTTEEKLEITPTWTDYGQVYVRQSYPLPSTVIAVIPEVVVVG